LVGVAFLWDRQRHPHIAGGNKLIPALLQNFPALASHLEQTHAVDQPLAVGPMERKAVRPATDGVLLIGDAAGYLDALTGEGISLALAQAIALEKTIVPFLLSALPTHLLTRHDMAAYEQAYRAIVRSYYRMTHLVLWLSRHPISAEQMIALLGRWPALFQYLLSANMGFVSLLETSSRKKNLRSAFQDVDLPYLNRKYF
jgi:flavin-dependent dehydrogenase